MASLEKTDDLNGRFSEASERPKNETSIANETTHDDLAYRDPFGQLSLVLSFMGFTFSYLPVFTAPFLVSLGLRVLEQSYGQSKNTVFIPASNTIGQCLGFFVAGRLSDTLGRRWFVIAGGCLSLIGYMVAGRAHNLATNIGGSFTFGVGTAIQLLSVMFGLELVPFNRRYFTYAYQISAWGPMISVAAGTVFTFIATADQSWRWVNYISFIATFVSLLLGLVFYHPLSKPTAQHTSPKYSVVKKIDWVGTVIWAGSTTSFLLGIYLGGQRYPWKSARTIAPLVIGGVGWFAAVGWEFATRAKFDSPVLSLLRKRNYVTLTLTLAFVSMCWTAPTLLWSQQIATLFGGNALVAGWYYGAALAGPVLGQLIAGVMATGLPMLQPQLILATVILLAFAPALAAYTVTQISMALVLIIASGTGVGIAEIICVVGATSDVSLQEFGIASGLLWTVRRISTSIANAIYTEILNHKVEKNLLGKVVPVLAQGGLKPEAIAAFLQVLASGDSTALAEVPGVTPQVLEAASVAAKTAFADSFKIVYLTSIAFGACAVITALLAKNSSLDNGRTQLVARRLRDAPTGKPNLRWIL